MDKQVNSHIEALRETMVAGASKHSLIHPEVVHVSQKLDLLIVKVQRQRQLALVNRKKMHPGGNLH